MLRVLSGGQTVTIRGKRIKMITEINKKASLWKIREFRH